MTKELKRDKEFEKVFGPLDAVEFAILKAEILAGRANDAIYVWTDEKGDEVIIDGHHNYKIRMENGQSLPEVISVDLPGRGEVIDWMYARQYGRRNVKPNRRLYGIGKMAERRCGPKGKPTPEGKLSSANLAEELDTSERQVQRGASLARAIDAANVPDRLKNACLDHVFPVKAKQLVPLQAKLEGMESIDRNRTWKELCSGETKVSGLLGAGRETKHQKAFRLVQSAAKRIANCCGDIRERPLVEYLEKVARGLYKQLGMESDEDAVEENGQERPAKKRTKKRQKATA